MRRHFNTEGCCIPKKHYMVGLYDRLEKIKRLYVDRGKYFIINCGYQYGKTTTLMELKKYLENSYVVISMDFQMISSTNFVDEGRFVTAFLRYLEKLLVIDEKAADCIETAAFQGLISLKNSEKGSMDRMFRGLSRMCRESEKPIVLMIDEVDNASNYHVFLNFLAMLRGYYLRREGRSFFQSVIFASVYDIRDLKWRLQPTEKNQYYSPWNIAADFKVEMSFSIVQIAAMLQEYEMDYQTGMDVEEVARQIYWYTSGYPYLVSWICKIVDEKLPKQEKFLCGSTIWNKEGIMEAVRIIREANISLFRGMIEQVIEFQELREILYEILFKGKRLLFDLSGKYVNVGQAYGFLKESQGYIVIANRIFEMILKDFFQSEESIKKAIYD